MTVWILLCLPAVVIVKYYTTVEMRKLERRLESVKSDLRSVKKKHEEVEGARKEVVAQEELYVQRIRAMKDYIQDLNIRLGEADAKREDAVGEGIKKAVQAGGV